MNFSLQVFGSSSAGNCSILWNRHGAILIDCGFPPRYILQRLHALGHPSSFVRAVVLTHTHGDHIHEGALRMLLDAGTALVCTPEVRTVLLQRSAAAGVAEERGLLRQLKAGMVVGQGISVTPFAVPHDTPGGCSGFRICEDTGRKTRTIVYATDLGYAREGLAADCSDADAMVMESNHDLGMLERSGRPQYLIDRIRRIGHLSNEQSSRFLVETVERSSHPPSHIVLAHISTQCNTPALALQEVSANLHRAGASGIGLFAAPPRGGSFLVHLP